MFGQRAVDMLRLSPNKHAPKFAHGEKSAFIGLSLKDRYVVHVLSTDVFKCQFNSSVLRNSPDMGILSFTATVAALPTEFQCIVSDPYIGWGCGGYTEPPCSLHEDE